MCKEVKVFKNWKLTYLSGLSLLVSFTLSHFGRVLDVDLAWAALILSGVPLVYVALAALVKHNGLHKITLPLIASCIILFMIYNSYIYSAGLLAFLVGVFEYFSINEL